MFLVGGAYFECFRTSLGHTRLTKPVQSNGCSPDLSHCVREAIWIYIVGVAMMCIFTF